MQHATQRAVAAIWIVSAIAGCAGGAPGESRTPPPPQATVLTQATETPTVVGTLVPTRPSTPATTAAVVPLLGDGPINPGTYYYVPYSCNPPRDCSDEEPQPEAPGIEVTVPSSRWAAATEFLAVWPRIDGSQTAALIMGWTNTEVGLSSEPCSQTSHQPTDIEVGPTVDDFVDAVAANPKLDITEPVDAELGGFSGHFFTLTAPEDLSGCDEWRPWDPGFFAQGPGNIWDVWVIDVDGFRILIVAQYFPETPADITSELLAMVDSIRFVPDPY